MVSFIIIAIVFFLTACEKAQPPSGSVSHAQALVELKMEGEPSTAEAEISGLCWCKDQLLLLPQYPDRFIQNDKGALFSISKQEILDYLDRDRSVMLRPQRIEFNEQSITIRIPGFQGYEAIVAKDSLLFMIIESRREDGMHTHLVQGVISDDLKKIALEPDKILPLDLPAQIFNMSYEALFLAGEKLIAIYELNGAHIVSGAAAVIIDPVNGQTGSVSLPAIEYRITDATEIDGQGNFWVLNYYWPGEFQRVKPAEDLLLSSEGEKQIFIKENAIERLIQLHYSPHGITFTGTRPIDIGSAANRSEGRNWEGIVRLENRGFLIITDKHPKTILAFVAGDSVLAEKMPNPGQDKDNHQ